jgi:hypothetical protein
MNNHWECFYLETGTKTIYFDKIWFKLNTDSNELKITYNKYE